MSTAIRRKIAVTSRLYGNDEQVRVRQELLLDVERIPGVEGNGDHSGFSHLNREHSGFAVLEAIRSRMEEEEGVS